MSNYYTFIMNKDLSDNKSLIRVIVVLIDKQEIDSNHVLTSVSISITGYHLMVMYPNRTR